MKFLKITDEYGNVQIVNPRHIARVYIREDDAAVRIIFAKGQESLTVSEPTFEELQAQLTGIGQEETA